MPDPSPAVEAPKRHRWKLDSSGDVDIFAYDGDMHNGPECLDCGRFGCHHCEPSMYEEECPNA